ncbi:MAG: large conductance mechanosensitive channel protein MscL [Patescibacteria group bacterium]|nr:MAG: large conductance mechanosensitive channel protein MscL [Patescibacteria group bacterium]
MQFVEVIEYIYSRYINFFVLILAFYLLIEVVKDLIVKYLHNIVTKTKKLQFDDEIVKTIAETPNYLILLISIKISTLFVSQLPFDIGKILNSGLFIAIVIELGKISNKIIEAAYKNIITTKKNQHLDKTLLLLTKRLTKILIWILLGLLTLQNLGYNVSTLIAGLGIGGIAIAFALQNILSDIFASFSIFFDRPFEINDYIVVGNNKGVVKNIGIKTTRITSLEGQEVIIPNKELTETIVENYGRIKNRRISLKLTIEYNTTNQKLKKAIEIIKDAIEKQKEVEKIDWVVFKSFSDSALVIEAVYYLKNADYLAYLKTQESINFEIKEKFEQEKIEFAYPSQTVYLRKQN